MTSAELNMLSANYQSLEVKHMVVFVSFEAMVLTLLFGWFRKWMCLGVEA